MYVYVHFMCQITWETTLQNLALCSIAFLIYLKVWSVISKKKKRTVCHEFLLTSLTFSRVKLSFLIYLFIFSSSTSQKSGHHHYSNIHQNTTSGTKSKSNKLQNTSKILKKHILLHILRAIHTYNLNHKMITTN